MKMGKKLKMLRESRNLTQLRFAEMLHVSSQSVQKWESDLSRPDLDHLIEIAKYFNVSLDAIILGSDLRIQENRNDQDLLPEYGALPSSEVYFKQLNVEYRQSVEEGLDVAAYQDLFSAVAKMPDGEPKEKMANILFDIVHNSKTVPDYAYDEPSSLSGIREKRISQVSDSLQYNLDVLRQKIEGAWYGRICGCLLGKPVEGVRTNELHPLLQKTGNFPMYRYIYASDLTDEICSCVKRSMKDRAYPDNISCAPKDDDTNYTVLYQRMIDRYGIDFTPADVAATWLKLQPKDAYCSAEHVAFCNFVKGYRPPVSACYQNPYREWIGAQIRADYFGYIMPGRPEKAAELAWRDACVSHTKNGIYGEMFVAAMLAYAAVCDDMIEIIRCGLSQIPPKSRLHEEITKILAGYQSGVTQEQCFAGIHQRYDEHDSHDWCHTNSNAAIVVASLLYGENNYAKSICMSVQCGFDTDCNGATVGSILGMKNGIGAIGSEWTECINGRLATSIFGVGEITVEALVEKTLEHIHKYCV